MGKRNAIVPRHHVSRVRAPDAHQQVIVARQVEGDVPFAFGAVLAADQYVHQGTARATAQAEMRRSAYFDVCFSAARSVNNDVRVIGEISYVAFGAVLSDLAVALELAEFRIAKTARVAPFEIGQRGFQVQVGYSASVTVPECCELTPHANGVD